MSGLARSVITMVQPAESLLSDDQTRNHGTNPAVRSPRLKSEIRTVLLMVTNILQEQSLEEAEARARMSFLQLHELLTQSEILEKEILPTAREADQHAGAEPKEAKHDQDL